MEMQINWGLVDVDVIFVDEVSQITQAQMLHMLKTIALMPSPPVTMFVGDNAQQLPWDNSTSIYIKEVMITFYFNNIVSSYNSFRVPSSCYDTLTTFIPSYQFNFHAMATRFNMKIEFDKCRFDDKEFLTLLTFLR